MNGFEIISKLGDGAYSVVYKVRRLADMEIYALKKVKLQNLSEKEKQNALNEVRILASVKSTFVISYKEAFIEESDQTLCIIMEYADKGDWYQKITQFKKKGCWIEEIDVWRIFIQMVRGLKAWHDWKIMHRDLKSANIFWFNDGSAKLGDLNVSKVARKGLGYTQTGTPYYASPEVWKDQPYDSKSDMWSWGCVTYEMLTLRPPFRAENMEGLYNKVIKGQFSKISDRYSQDMSEIIKIMLKVHPNERPSCGQLLKHPLILKRLEFFQANAGTDSDDIGNMDEAELLKTIRIPKNIWWLTEKLPASNYIKGKNGEIRPTAGKSKAKETKKNMSFPSSNWPDIKIPSRIVQRENKNAENRQKKPGEDNYCDIEDRDNHQEKKREYENNHNSIKNESKNSIKNNKGNYQSSQINSKEGVNISNSHRNSNSKNTNSVHQVNVKPANDLPNVHSIDSSSPLIPLTQRKNIIIGKQAKNSKDLGKYMKELSNLYKIYAPNLEYYSNDTRNKWNWRNQNVSHPKVHPYQGAYKVKQSNNSHNKVIPNKRLNPIQLNVGNVKY